ncbi:MAG TPA: hypothetical protein VF062_21495 [Candidatus Limnocylindrales bacterium]
MTADAPQFDNPIVYIEEFGRVPRTHRRRLFPSTAIVYRSRHGRLSSPPGGYTAGELLWRRPREAYHVDVARHPCALDCPLTVGEPPQPLAARLAASWQVTDPVAAVASRVTQVRFIALFVAWSWCMQELDMGAIGGPAQLFGALGRRLPVSLRSEFGITINLTAVNAISRAGADGSNDLRALEMVLGTDATAAWHADFTLSQTALLAMPDEFVMTPELAALSRKVIHRFADMVERFGELLPYEGDAETLESAES